MNESNLIPLSQRTKEERREIATQGGIASGQSRRERKAIRELLEEALALPYTDMMSGKESTNGEAVVAALVRRAIDGDVSAARLIVHSVDGLPKATLEVEPQIDPEVYRRVEAALAGDLDD